MKVLFATALLAVAEATQLEAQGHVAGWTGYDAYAAPAYYGKTSYVKSYAKPVAYVRYNGCGHHTDSDSSSDSDCGAFYTSDYSDNDHGYGYRHYHGKSYYYKYAPRYYGGAYRYGRKYATYGGKYGYATYRKEYGGYGYRSYRPSAYYRASTYKW